MLEAFIINTLVGAIAPFAVLMAILWLCKKTGKFNHIAGQFGLITVVAFSLVFSGVGQYQRLTFRLVDKGSNPVVKYEQVKPIVPTESIMGEVNKDERKKHFDDLVDWRK